MKAEELLKVLEELEEESFQKFKWHLEEAKIPKGHKGIPKSKLEKAEKQGIVDLMVQSYKTSEIVEVTRKILEKIPRIDLVERLCDSSSGAKALSPTSNLKATELKFQSLKTKLLSDDPSFGLDTLSLSDSPFERLREASLTSDFDSKHSRLREPKLSFNHSGASGSKLRSAGLDHSHFRLDSLRLKQSGEQTLPSSVTTYTRELTVDQNQTGSNVKMSYHNSTETTTHHSSSSSSSLSDPFDRHFSSMLHRKF